MSALTIYAWMIFCTAWKSVHTWGGEYRKEDDATVIPIVLPIVGCITLLCVLGCCVQGRKCCWNKNNENEKIPGDLEGNTLGRQRLSDVVSVKENAQKSKHSQERSIATKHFALPVQVTNLSSSEIYYSRRSHPNSHPSNGVTGTIHRPDGRAPRQKIYSQPSWNEACGNADNRNFIMPARPLRKI
ncbi:uncharacterized protein LOC143469259 [Clavelina lepadiformis]|uniref:Uncharacterized protein n=1 Tax=Clavelina lepadiformis TaxID=159417 RepID=A0ABP0F549_CLALP